VTPEIFSEWLRRRGQRVLRTASSYWHSEGLRVFQAFPYHWLIQPSEQELRQLNSEHRVVALRYSMPWTGGAESNGYHVVYTGPGYDLERLGAWARKNVRRGLRSCSVGPISFPRYIEEGWALRVDTLARQERRLQESRDDWCRKYSAAADLEGFEVWAAEVDHQLAATLLIFQMDGWAYMIYQQCHRDYLREHVNNALSFAVTEDLMRRPNIRGIFYGMRSLDAPPSVDEFKFRMGYEARPVRQCVAFHPYLAPLVNPLTRGLAKSLAAASPGSRFLAKAEGMLRLGLEEKISVFAAASAGLPPAKTNDQSPSHDGGME
jgi:hypothetical protein